METTTVTVLDAQMENTELTVGIEGSGESAFITLAGETYLIDPDEVDALARFFIRAQETLKRLAPR